MEREKGIFSNGVFLGLLKIALYFLFIGLLCEFSVRVVEKVMPALKKYAPYQANQEDKIFNHDLKPNFSSQNMTYDGKWYDFAADENGFRKEITLKSNDGDIIKVYIVGDSFTLGMEEQYTVSTKLRNLLGYGYEVVNAGVSTHSTVIHYLRIKNKILKFRPDVIVLNFDLTDFYDDNVRYLDLTSFKGKHVPVAVRPKFDLRNFIKKYSHLSQYTFHLYHILQLKYQPQDTKDPSEIFVPDADQVAYTTGLIGRINEICKENGVLFMVTLYPHKEQLKGFYWDFEPVLDLISYCDENKIPLIDTYPYFTPYKVNDIFYEHDMHFNSKGQDIWSEVLANRLAPKIIKAFRK